MNGRSDHLPGALEDYIQSHSTPPDPVLSDLAEETRRRFGDEAGMQIGPDQGMFMQLLGRLTGAASAVEIGTFTGYSSICIARGLAPGGRMLCCDVSDEYTAVAREYWKRAGLDGMIELRIGPAAGTLRALPAGTSFDLAFIDADKTGYPDYWELIVPMIRPGGIILADNTLQSGQVADPSAEGASVAAIREFNDRVLADERTEVVLLPVGDGLTLARKL
ncbi:MAG TPA: O-methyltransferase [Streptosporangiaceae bacterium]